MSLAATMVNALSGLTANARTTEVIAANLTNARTPGYGARALALSTGTHGGVVVDGVLRALDLPLLNDLRAADADAAASRDRAAFFSRIEQAIGVSGEPGALDSRIAELRSALIRAGAQPDAQAVLGDVLGAARKLAAGINRIGETIQTARREADSAIARQVEQVNDALGRLQTLNARIVAASAGGGTPASLIDQRQALIDTIAGIVPLKQIARPDNGIGLFTTFGGALFDGGRPMRLEFTPARMIDPAMTRENGALSGLRLNGMTISTDHARGITAGGSLAGQFRIRDELGVTAQRQLDSLARDLVERFADPGTDPTLTAGGPGLFTDAGGPFDPSGGPGLAQRLAVNDLADPDRGGNLTTLRDGFGASAPSEAGNAAILNAMERAMGALRQPSDPTLTEGNVDLVGLGAVLLSDVTTSRLSAEADTDFTTSRAHALRETRQRQTVDSDAELQRLLVVEKAFAANARVIQATDEMMQSLLRM